MTNLERELANHHAAALRAVETGRFELAERRLKAYVLFAKAFVDAAASRGGGFLPDNARSVSFFDWPTASQIIRYAWDCIVAAAKSGSTELVIEALHLPVEFMIMSVREKDFLFYWRMIQVYPDLLSLSYGTDLTRNKNLVVDRCLRHLQDFGDFHLVEFTKSYEQDIRQQYVSQLLWAFSDLLKIAADHNDDDRFGEIGRGLNRLFDSVQIHDLAWEEVTKWTSFADFERKLIWLGLGAWLIRSQVLQDTPRIPGYPDPRLVDPSRIGRFLESVSGNFDNIRSLAAVYLKAFTDHHALHSYWNRWLMETLPEREVHSVDYGYWLTVFYVVQGLRLSGTGHPNANDVPVPDRELQFRIRDIETIIGQIEREPEKWAPIVGNSMIPSLAEHSREELSGRISYFLSANRVAITQWSRRREFEIIQAPLDESRVAEFRQDLYKGWADGAFVTRLLIENGRTEVQSAQPDEVYFAVNFTMPKEWFISEREGIYLGSGGHQAGAALARDKNKQLIGQMKSAVTSVEPIGEGGCVEKTITLVNEMNSRGLRPSLIVLGRYELLARLQRDSRFVAKWQDPNRQGHMPHYYGTLEGTPVFFWPDQQTDNILVADFGRIGRLVQFLPQKDGFNELIIRITPIDGEQARKFIDDHPEKMKGKDGSTKSKEDAMRELQTQVVIFAGCKLELEVTDPGAAVLLPVLRDEVDGGTDTNAINPV